jgi:hypothetical protein
MRATRESSARLAGTIRAVNGRFPTADRTSGRDPDAASIATDKPLWLMRVTFNSVAVGLLEVPN